MSQEKKRKPINMRLQPPADLHDILVLHQIHLQKTDDPATTLEQASYDLWRRGAKKEKHLKVA